MRIDYFTTAPPWPQDSGARLRVGAIYETLRRRGCDARILLLGERPGTALSMLRRYSLGALSGRSPISASFVDASRIERLGRLVADDPPDAILIGNVYLAPLVPMLSARAPAARVIIDNHNVESLLHQRLHDCADSLPARLQTAILARTTLRLEREHLPLATQVWACSGEDASYFRRAFGLSSVRVVPNAIDTDAFSHTGTGEEAAIVFTGWFRYWPNADAARRLIDASRRLRARGVRHTLYLVGKDPTAGMVHHARNDRGIVVTGAIPDVRPYLARARVFAAPLTAGSGTRLKLLQAMAMGKAIVTTALGAEGLDLIHDVHAIVTDHRDEFERQIVRLLEDPHARVRLGNAARSHVVRHFSMDAIDRAVSETLREMPRLPG